MHFDGLHFAVSVYIIIITTNERDYIMINATTLKTIRNADMATINALIKEIKARQSAIQNETADAFRVGQSVYFTAKRGALVKGVVQKINKQTIKVKADDVVWRVSPSLLSHA